MNSEQRFETLCGKKKAEEENCISVMLGKDQLAGCNEVVGAEETSIAYITLGTGNALLLDICGCLCNCSGW